MVPNYIKEKVLENATRLDKFGIRDLAWNKENAENVIFSIMQDDIGILGGDVYILKNNRLIPLYDNWYCEPNVGETRNEFHLRSKKKALDYVASYNLKVEGETLFALIFTEILD